MRLVLLAPFLVAAAFVAWQPAVAQNANVMTTAQFLGRCKVAPGFCRQSITAELTSLTSARKACPPPKMSKTDIAIRVQNVLGDALEEAPDIFGAGAYQGFVDQIIVFLWPCENRIIS